MRFAFSSVTHECWPSAHSNHAGHPETDTKTDESIATSLAALASHLTSHTPSKDKLVGKFSWPFSLNLPRSTEVNDEHGVKKAYKLPGHMYADWTRSVILYRITVKVVYHSLLHSDDM